MDRTLVKRLQTKVGTKHKIIVVFLFGLHVCRGNKF